MPAQLLRWVVAVVLAGSVGFAIGVLVGASQGWLQPAVAITVVNQTGQDLIDLQILYKSARSNGSIALPPLSVGERTIARFYLAGEGSYTVRAKLKDGSTLKEQERYVESGYAMTEVLTASGSTSTMQYRESGK